MGNRSDSANADRKALALEFLRLLRTGDRDGAARPIVPDARHHSAYFSAGVATLIFQGDRIAERIME